MKERLLPRSRLWTFQIVKVPESAFLVAAVVRACSSSHRERQPVFTAGSKLISLLHVHLVIDIPTTVRATFAPHERKL
jgi:hypothetical protein